MAFSFFAVAAYVTFESVRALVSGHDPDSSPVGIGLATASLLIMPFLSWAQRRIGKALGSNAVVADSTQTLLFTYLPAVLLVGLALNATLGWSWADPLAGLVIAAVAVKEGREAWRGEGCCGPISTAHAHDVDQADRGRSDGGCTDGCCTPTEAVASPGSNPEWWTGVLFVVALVPGSSARSPPCSGWPPSGCSTTRRSPGPGPWWPPPESRPRSSRRSRWAPTGWRIGVAENDPTDLVTSGP